MGQKIKLSDDEIEKILRDYRLQKEAEKEAEKEQNQRNNECLEIEKPSKIDGIKDWLHQKNISVLPIVAIILLFISIGITLLLIAIVGYVDILVNYPDWFLKPFLFFIYFYSIYIYDRIQMKFFLNLNIYNGKRDWKRNDFVSVHGTLFSCFTINSLYSSLRLFFRKQKAEGHICNVLLMNRSKIMNTDYFLYILTKNRLDALQIIYNAESKYVKGSMVSREIIFKNEVPLIITYGKHSHVLKSIAPAEGYEYTEEQLAAIEKFNTLYP